MKKHRSNHLVFNLLGPISPRNKSISKNDLSKYFYSFKFFFYTAGFLLFYQIKTNKCLLIKQINKTEQNKVRYKKNIEVNLI